MKEALERIIKDEDGQGMVEYGLMIAGIATAAIAATALIGPILTTKFQSLEAAINGN